MTRHLLHPAKLTVTIERKASDGYDPDLLVVNIRRDDHHILRAEIERGDLLECNEGELAASEEAQVSAAIAAEWLAWPGEPELPMGTIEEVLERLAKAIGRES
jgi:hypothetical protein